ncbi:MAG TPA: hypothetical protein VGF43_09255 [Dongiaceae bacterium]|jgi:hypothetical protein
MSSRRFVHRKPPNRPLSKTVVRVCILLGAIAVILSVSSNLMPSARTKARDLALESGFIDLDSCVVTTAHSIACTSNAAGTPVPVALQHMQDVELEAATERKQRLDAENTVRSLALEVARLTSQIAQLQQTEQAPFPAGEVTPTARTNTPAEGDGGSVMTSGTEQQSSQLSNTPTSADDAIPFSFTPPDVDTP